MTIFTQSLYIGIGGFLGAIVRFLLSKGTQNWFGGFPFGTLLVNVSGSFVLGFILTSATLGKAISQEFRSFSTIGFIGAFTTMSTFAYESTRLFELRNYTLFGINLFLNVFLCLAAIMAGQYLSEMIFG